MKFLVIERFRGGDPRPVGDRFRERGRMMPDLVEFVASWIDPAKCICYQVMQAPDAESLQPWIDAWKDLVDFEVIPVVDSPEFWAGQ